ncbi:hypothetical protein CUMW_175470 [Citrus unshiu]|uniref:Secreted protein n=1 Tax=Citrus unshiu TaxID=55188 RepID=A0A2H5PX41_CITUN|nr:hypothetical protein CUMW_175470 [Citrus unshiu]
MMWQILWALKFLCTVDGDVAAYQVDEKSRVRYMHHTGLFSTKPRYCSSESNRVTVHPSQTVLLFIRVVKPWTVD